MIGSKAIKIRASVYHDLKEIDGKSFSTKIRKLLKYYQEHEVDEPAVTQFIKGQHDDLIGKLDLICDKIDNLAPSN